MSAMTDRHALEDRLQRLLDVNNHDYHALLHIEVDQHDLIHSKYGSTASAALNEQIYKLLQNSNQRAQNQGFIAKINTSEYALLLTDCNINQARNIAEALRQALTNHVFNWQGSQSKITCSIGMAAFSSAEQAKDLLNAASNACQVAKIKGINSIHVHRPVEVETLSADSELELVSSVVNALDSNRLALDFQPIISLSKQPSGSYFELLLRMRDEYGNAVAPNDFLPAVERYNLAAGLDRWVIASSITWLNQHPQHLEKIDCCSINLSNFTLEDNEFLNDLSRSFDNNRHLAKKIHFEIKEETAINNSAQVTHFMRRLRDKGCHFILADFGFGWTSYAYLKNTPIRMLKINGALINSMLDDSVDYAIVKSICDVGHAMGKQIIATQVETEAVFNALAELGIDYAQGHYFNHPKPLDQFALEPA